MPSIFPQNGTEVVNNVIISRRLPAYGKSPVFDFTAGEFKKVDNKVYIGEGQEVLRNWIEKTLRTERYRFPLYSFNYGVTLEELVHMEIPFDLLENELESRITEALLQDVRIVKVGNFDISRKGSSVEVQFEVTTFDSQRMNMEVSV